MLAICVTPEHFVIPIRKKEVPPLTAMDSLFAGTVSAAGRGVPSFARMGLARVTSGRTHLLAPATMVRPGCSMAPPTPISLMSALSGCLGYSTNLLTLTLCSEEDKHQRERHKHTKMSSLDHGFLRQEQVGWKFNGW